MLTVFGGLPGTGETTLARKLANRLSAVYLRIDTIGHALARSVLEIDPTEDAGYQIGYAVAAENLALGHVVVADAVNPIDMTRSAWRAVAEHAGCCVVEMEVVCSDAVEHRRRVESRTADLPGFRLPSWGEVSQPGYEPWTTGPVIIDTAGRSVADCLRQLAAAVAG